MKEHFKTFAYYNQWANNRLFDACNKLSIVDYLKQRQAFFNSIHGTLNHILVADRLWLGRLTSTESGIKELDQILFQDLQALLAARLAEDKRLIQFIEQLDPQQLNQPFTFKTLVGKEQTLPFAGVLSHIFNHQTHHRGQVHNMLSQTHLSPLPLDFYYYMLG